MDDDRRQRLVHGARILRSGFFSDAVRPSEAQRFYDTLCIAYGGWPDKFGFLVDSFNLNANRAKYCQQDYRRLRRSFRQTIMPHRRPRLAESGAGEEGLAAQVG